MQHFASGTTETKLFFGVITTFTRDKSRFTLKAGYIDAWDRGTLKIYNSCKEHGLPETDIQEKEGGFMVVLHKAFQDADKIGAIGSVIDSLTDRQKDVFKIIKENKEVTYKGIAEKLSINESAVGEPIKGLKEKGAIKRDDSTKGKGVLLINS